ncbi:MAG: hypothetical protein OEW83_02340 [Acidimicrobiia bacterium]|nr:hypothetical protein [Acidimicrobiia bacterium]
MLAAVGEVLLAPGALALYHALKRLDRTRMLLGAASIPIGTVMLRSDVFDRFLAG